MARETGANLAKVETSNLPDYVKTYAENDTSKDSMKEHVKLPFLRVLQGLSPAELVSTYGVGTALFSPGDTEVVRVQSSGKESDSVKIVPVFYFTEFIFWADRDDLDGPPIINRSIDPKSELAARCKNRDTWEQEYGEKGFKGRNDERLCFACMIYDKDHPMYGILFVIAFSGGEYKSGSSFIQMASMRDGGACPLFAQVYHMKTVYRDKGPQKKWWGIDISPVPKDDNAYVEKEDIDFFSTKHKELHEAWTEKRLEVDQGKPETVSKKDGSTEEF